MKKVVINTCYGGFGISPKALKRYYELKYPEKTLCFYSGDFNGSIKSRVYTRIQEPDAHSVILSEDFGDSFVINYDSDNELWDKFNKAYVYDSDFDRTDPILVQVVEELGEEANGFCAKLTIKEVKDKYRICEYDGNEWIETPESIVWKS